jgi:hypothetical protein
VGTARRASRALAASGTLARAAPGPSIAIATSPVTTNPNEAANARADTASNSELARITEPSTPANTTISAPTRRESCARWRISTRSMRRVCATVAAPQAGQNRTPSRNGPRQRLQCDALIGT